MKGFLIRGFNSNRDYPVNIYRSMLYIEGENLYLKTSDDTFHLSGNISSGGQTNLDNYYTKLEMDSILDNIQIEGYITVEDLSEYITNDKLIEEIAKLNQVDFNIDDYLKIEDLDNNVTSIIDYSIAQLLDGAPEAFDTLREISDWINVNENKTFDLIEQVSLKADKSEIPSIEGLASETFVTEAISAIEFPEIDLTAYETKDDNDVKLSLKADKSEIPSIDGLASETFVTEAISAIEFPETDLTAYEKIVDNDAKLLLKADKSELIGLASETFVTEAINDIEFPETDLTNYSTTLEMDSAISEAIAKAQLEGGDVDLNAYETKVDNEAKLLLKADKSELIGLATETFVTEAIGAIEFPETDLTNYSTTLEMDSAISEAINSIEFPETDLTLYETKDDNDAKLLLKVDKVSGKGLSTEDYTTADKIKLENIDSLIENKISISISEIVDGAPETFDTLKEIADWIENDGVSVTELSNTILTKANKSELIGLATETFVTEAISAIDFPETDLTAYEKIVDNDAKLSLKANKSELIGLATETFVTEAINAIDFPETDLTAYEKIVDNDAKLLLKADKSEIPSIEGLATETFVTEAIGDIEFPEINLDNYVTTETMNSRIGEAIAQAQLEGSEVNLTVYETKVDNEAKLLLKADKSELIGLATETFVTEAINAIDFPETDLTAYEKSIDVDVKLSLKADKSEIPSIEGLATETFVTEAIGDIDFPETDLTAYEKSIDVDAKLLLKADKTYVDNIFDNKVDKVTNKGLSTEDYTTEDKEKLRNIENIIDTKINSSIGNLVDGAPETFDTLREIADWIESDGVVATEISTSVSNKVDIDVFETSVSDERTLSNEMYVSKSSEQKTELYKGGEMISTSPKIWVGRAETTTAGSWSVDYSDAGFTVPPNVTATAYCRNDGSAAGDASYASIIGSSITTTGCSGRLSSATSAGLLAAMVSTSADGSISIIAIGI